MLIRQTLGASTRVGRGPEGSHMKEQLPLLDGTPTQISWAEQVRNQKLLEMERYADDMVAARGAEINPAERAALRAQIIRRFAPILAQTSARYWVNLSA